MAGGAGNQPTDSHDRTRHVRVVNAAIGEHLCELTINPDREYQPRTPK